MHRFHNEQPQELGGHLLGRRLYETMVYWETADQDPSLSDYALEFGTGLAELPKVVFSTTLESVEGNTRLVRDGCRRGGGEAEGAAGQGPGRRRRRSRLRPDRGGPRREYRPFVYPVVTGGGTPFLPPVEETIDLELIETRTFSSRVVYLRYQRA